MRAVEHFVAGGVHQRPGSVVQIDAEAAVLLGLE
jgi:hypothetical protein